MKRWHPTLDPKDIPLFDASPTGHRLVVAERFDEPGDERPTEHGISDPTVRHRKRAGVIALLTADDSCGGDWSWKPNRDRLLGPHMRTFRGVPAGAAELYRASAFSRS